MNRVRRKIDIIYNEYANKDITLIHIADIHFNKSTKYKKLIRLKENIIKNNPDYVVITGDLIDEPSITKDKNKIKELIFFLTSLSKYSKILISLGNHDIFKEEDYKFFRKINDINNIYLLDNEYYKDEFIYISGITLPSNYYYNIYHDESSDALINHLNQNRKLISRLPVNIPKIMLIHSPIKLIDNNVLEKLHDYDLLLSGHTHNGMVPNILEKIIPDNYGIIAPNKKLFPRLARGKMEKYIKNHKITIIINGGVTKLSLKSSKLLSSFNWLYDISINKIIITKKRGKKYE
ncbi:MAG: metallophosphoesterase [Bacilli bacterium]|nr:metallophosphoesterase [Bacilli bacterium]